jgi:hypothetical protein
MPMPAVQDPKIVVDISVEGTFHVPYTTGSFGADLGLVGAPNELPLPYATPI